MIIAIPLLAVGIALFVLGLRGWTVGTDPHCRACGYDLAGIDSPETCPECGNDLAAARAVRPGARRKIAAFKPLGLVLALFSGAFIGAQVYLNTKNLPASKRPLWMLKLDVRSAVDARADDAMFELGSRHAQQKISDETYASLLDQALARHGNANYVWRWNNPWQSAIVWAHTTGVITPEQHERYRRQVLTGVEFSMLEKEYRMFDGDQLFWLGEDLSPEPRALLGEIIIAVAWPTSVTWNGEEVAQTKSTFLERESVGPYETDEGWKVTSVATDLSFYGLSTCVVTQQERPEFYFPRPRHGMNEYEVVYDIEYYVEPNEASKTLEPWHWRALKIAPETEPVRRESKSDSFTIEVVREASETLTPVTLADGVPQPDLVPIYDNATRSRVEWEISCREDAALYPPNGCVVSGKFTRYGQPHDAAYGCFTVCAIIGGERIPFVSVSDWCEAIIWINSPGESGDDVERHRFSGAMEAGVLTGDSLDIVLVPNPDKAVYFVDAKNYWNEEIVIRDIPLDWPDCEHPTLLEQSEAIVDR